MKMGIIVQLPLYRQSFCYETIAQVMPKNRFQDLLNNLHFVNNLEIEKGNKLEKVRPIINAVREEYIKVEPEEYRNIDEQIIPSKTKYSVLFSQKAEKMGIHKFGKSWRLWIHVRFLYI